jgi:hypothetical protein
MASDFSVYDHYDQKEENPKNQFKGFCNCIFKNTDVETYKSLVTLNYNNELGGIPNSFSWNFGSTAFSKYSSRILFCDFKKGRVFPF